jgi:hypothetical protein
MYVLKFKTALSIQADFIIAIAAIYWSTFVGLEWHFTLFATLGAYRRKHLAFGSKAATTFVTLCFPCFATRWTTLRLISVAFGGKEFLLLSTEGESDSTITALNCFVYKTHWMTSSLLNSWFELAIHHLSKSKVI